jgi:hypothetical protein
MPIKHKTCGKILIMSNKLKKLQTCDVAASDSHYTLNDIIFKAELF